MKSKKWCEVVVRIKCPDCGIIAHTIDMIMRRSQSLSKSGYLMDEKVDIQTLRQVAEAAPRFPWAMSKPYQNEWGHTIHAVGPEFERDDDEDFDGYDFHENTLLEVWGAEYPSEPTARFIATFDPPTILDLIDRVALRDEALFEEIGMINGEFIYRMRP